MTQTETPATQRYLKVLYALEAEGLTATTSRLAARLTLSPASVSAMVRRLAEAELAWWSPNRRAGLTDAGRAAALSAVRRHRLLETYLHRALGVPWDEVHDEAERHEHALSPALEQRIDAALGYPTRDPHGDPIPQPAAAHHEAWTDSLDRAVEGARVRVIRVADRDPAALRHLAPLGIVPDADLRVESRSPFDGPIWVQVGAATPAEELRPTHPLAPRLAALVFVAPRHAVQKG